MAEERGLIAFGQRLRAEVIEASGGEHSEDQTEGPQFEHYKENVFTRIVGGYLSDLGVIEDLQSCYYESRLSSGHVKVNGYHIDEEDGGVDLFVSIYKHAETISSVSHTEIRMAAERLGRFLNQAMSGQHKRMEAASDQYGMARSIYEMGEAIRQVRLFILTDAFAAGETHFSLHSAGVPMKANVWDIRRLHRSISSGLGYEPIEIDFQKRYGKPLPCLSAEGAQKDYEAYLAIIPGDVLYDLYDEYGSRLLELNVRSFLQARGKVNRGIRDTLKNEPQRFLAYNNGISATADGVTFCGEKGSAIAAIRGLQIVNGGQTMASIYHSKKADKVDLSQVFVQAKITVVEASRLRQIVPQISRYANSQNKVSDADFSANDAYHVAMEHLADTTWTPGEQSRWFYERARGQYQVAKFRYATTKAKQKRFEAATPATQRFTKTDLAKYLNCWAMLPHVVSRGSQKNFVAFMDVLRQSVATDWVPDQNYYRETIGKAIIFRRTERIVRSLEVPAFRANVVAYLVSFLCARTLGRIDLRKVWDAQGISEGLEDALSKWCISVYNRIVESAGDRNVTEWCKKQDCWIDVKSLTLDVPKKLRAELLAEQSTPTVGQGGQKLTFEDSENISKVMKVPAEAWLSIHGWGVRTKSLPFILAGVAHTLSGYAASGWTRIPSAKQANAAAKILKIVRESGDLKVDLD
jgi:hypothetical protein